MSQKGGFQELLFATIMPKVYGIGASVVIVGAMFKILHLPGSSLMLGIGLTVEAIIFFLSAFEPPHPEPDWSKVYPELSLDYDGPSAAPVRHSGPAATGVAGQMDKMMEDAKIGPDLLKGLGDGIRNLADSASKMSKLGDAALATNEYADNMRSASKTLLEMNKAYGISMQAIGSMAEASKGAQDYQSQVQTVTKSLGALNALYEMELQDSHSHTKALNQFYSNVTDALGSMVEAGKETAAFQLELNQLTSNVANLNKVYGGMLTAMKS
ncbi:MAG: gliding motility protein GldL [Flammeovirgaceae bacterium]|jgi:gliding motility-associated protein GldL|nr:gliding motility protein GldL [Flammeovirgaceae bacterium]|tara:strand:- start:8489 stop:9295 length:807 start_codon:yes stop_codon:yes gene_type:complete